MKKRCVMPNKVDLDTSTTTWMPLYIGDYLSQTMDLDLEQQGAYILLMCYCWKNGGKIKNDSKKLQKIVKKTPKKLQKILPEIMQFFYEIDGYLRHEAIDRELAKALENKERNRRKTEAATAARWKKKPSVTDSVTDNVTDSVTYSPSPSPLPIKENKTKVLSKKRAGKDDLEMLEIDDVQNWLDEKRAEGKYRSVDEERLLELFKDYCRANNRTYNDYVAAFRNSFNWNNAPKKGEVSHANFSKIDYRKGSEGVRLL
jgi:uncharacterized protein YdaU (DUF1376 family)